MSKGMANEKGCQSHEEHLFCCCDARFTQLLIASKKVEASPNCLWNL